MQGGLNKVSIQLIQQAICYMEEHIGENISFTEVAKSVHMSSYNFHRTFSFITGMTANEYIKKRRLTLAAKELQTTDSLTQRISMATNSRKAFPKLFHGFMAQLPDRQNGKERNSICLIHL